MADLESKEGEVFKPRKNLFRYEESKSKWWRSLGTMKSSGISSCLLVASSRCLSSAVISPWLIWLVIRRKGGSGRLVRVAKPC
jgi:hypothetical protein